MILVSWSLIGCSGSIEGKDLGVPRSGSLRDRQQIENKTQANRLSEVAPPRVINQLDSLISKYQPQVQIISPKTDQLFSDNSVIVEVEVKDLPIFQDSQFNLGPYLQLILDKDTYIPIHNLDKPIVLKDLKPGTHTLRLFAVKPWQESFKNEGAYGQTTFHIYTQTEETPNPSLPLLTYNSPLGVQGTEPTILDFYLTNAPLHFVARQNPDDDISDWRIKVTINDESFLLDDWKPIYLKGFQQGINWVKLEFLNDNGEKVTNLFNTSVQLISYQPNGQDSLSKLFRGEIPVEIAQSIIDPNYIIPTETTPETEVIPEVETKETTPETEVIPEVETKETTPETEVIPEVETKETTPETEVIPEVETKETTPETEVIPEVETKETTPETEVIPEVEIIETPSETEVIPEVEITETIPPEDIRIKFEEGLKVEEIKNSQWLEKMFQKLENLGN